MNYAFFEINLLFFDQLDVSERFNQGSAQTKRDYLLVGHKVLLSSEHKRVEKPKKVSSFELNLNIYSDLIRIWKIISCGKSDKVMFSSVFSLIRDALSFQSLNTRRTSERIGRTNCRYGLSLATSWLTLYPASSRAHYFIISLLEWLLSMLDFISK